MTEHIFLFIEQELSLERASSLVIDNQGSLIEPFQVRELEQLQQLCNGKELIIILPNTVLGAHLVDLPTLKKADLMIPNILEEELIGDIDETHFVLQSQIKIQDLYLVYSINKNIFDNLLEQFKEYNLEPECITSELLTSFDNHLLIGDLALQVITKENLGLLQNYLLPCVELETLENLNIIKFENSSKKLIQFVNKHNLKIQEEKDISYQYFIAQELLKQTNLNILQGHYRKKQKHGRMKKILSVPLLVMSLVVFIGANIINYQQLNSKLTILKKDNFTRYKKVFPNASSMVSPKFRIEGLIKNNLSNNKQLFISIMSRSAPLLKNQTKLSVLSLIYQNSKLNITFTLPNFNELEKLQQSLESNSVTVNQISATTKENIVNAVWRLSL